VGDEQVAEALAARSAARAMLESESVEAIQAIFGSEPDEAARVLSDRQHGLLRQSVIQSEALEAHGHRRLGCTTERGQHNRERRHRWFFHNPSLRRINDVVYAGRRVDVSSTCCIEPSEFLSALGRGWLQTG
jgi:hypothetical protein